MRKKFFLGLFLAFFMLVITGCFDNNNENKDNNVSSESMSLENIINNKKSLVSELYFDDTSDDISRKTALEVFKTWPSLIGFSGYQVGSGYIELVSFENNPSKSFFYYYTGSSKYIDFRCTYYNDFSLVDADEMVLQLEAIYGVDIDEDFFRGVVDDYKVTVYDLESKSYNNTVIYNENNIYVEIAELNDGENRIINFASSYNKKK